MIQCPICRGDMETCSCPPVSDGLTPDLVIIDEYQDFKRKYSDAAIEWVATHMNYEAYNRDWIKAGCQTFDAGFETAAAIVRQWAEDRTIPSPTHADSHWQNDLINELRNMFGEE